MITKIHLENFKGFKERQTIELKPITLLFGPNSGGKSTVIQAIHYMREILDRRNFDPDRTVAGGDAIDLGGFENMVYGHDLSLPIIMQFDMDLTNIDLPSYVDLNEEFNVDYQLQHQGHLESLFAKVTSGYVQVEVRWNEELQKPIAVKYETGINSEYFARIVLDRITANNKSQFNIAKDINFNHKLLKVEVKEQKDENFFIHVEANIFSSLLREEEYKNGMPLDQVTAIPVWGSKLLIPSLFPSLEHYFESKAEFAATSETEIRDFLTLGLVGIGELLNNDLKKLIYIGPLRKMPKRNYLPPRFSADQTWADGSAAWDLIYQSERSFIKAVNTWLTDRLHCGFSVKSAESTKLSKDEPLITCLMSASVLDEETNIKSLLRNKKYQKEFSFIDANTGIECQAMDIGVGISQVFPVVVAALENKFPLVLIEQPELHIHPAIQVNLGDLFISAIKSNDRMIIAETHSEHLILRILKRIEQTTQNALPPDSDPVKPEQISVMWFEPTIDGIKVTALPIDETGEFRKKWPRGFFEERAEELFG